MEQLGLLGPETTSILDRVSALESVLETLARDAAALERHDRLVALGEVSGLIAHEFNNLLTPIRTYAQLALANSNDPELIRKALSKALDGSTKAAQVAQLILGIAKQGDSRPTRPPCSTWNNSRASIPCDTAAVVREAAETVNVDVQFARSSGPGSPLLGAAVPPLALGQVVSNLLLNAHRASKTAALPITCSVTRMASADDADELPSPCSTWNNSSTERQAPSGDQEWIAIDILDHGSGMSAERLRTVADAATAKHTINNSLPEHTPHGHGLGLELCRRLTHAMGGWLIFASKRGEGTLVRLVVPAAPAQAVADHVAFRAGR